MNFLCPSCRTPLPRVAPEHVTCSGCGVAVDLTRVDTAPGQARLWPEIDLTAESLSGYSLLKLLGTGGMGSVYEARGADGNIVALKVLSPLLAAEPALRERFRREARALATISHPGVVKMLGEGEENSFCWYAMERIAGSDLRETLKSGPLTAAQVVGLAKTMLEALEVVHAAGFIHRDVKPSNILLSAEGPKLCDFGIARLEGASTLTESAALLGSLRYMAPEQRWGKSDARSDLYALGVVMHEALALGVPGEKPLPASTPASLTRLIAKLTETNAALRPQSAAEAKRMLLASSKAPVLLGAAALLTVVAVATYLLLPLAAQRGEALTVDAGAEPTAVLAAPDASIDADAGALAVIPVDAGSGLSALIGKGASTPVFGSTGLGTKGGMGDSLRDVLGKIDSSADGGTPSGINGFGIRGTKGTGIGTRGKPTTTALTEVPEGKSKKLPTKKPAPTKSEQPIDPELAAELAGGGMLEVAGTGAATVYDGKTTLGDAPGNFNLRFGGHAVRIVCKVGGKESVHKVGLSIKGPVEHLNFACPES